MNLWILAQAATSSLPEIRVQQQIDWTSVMLALIASLPATMTALLTLLNSKRNSRAIQKVSYTINGGMEELLQAKMQKLEEAKKRANEQSPPSSPNPNTQIP